MLEAPFRPLSPNATARAEFRDGRWVLAGEHRWVLDATEDVIDAFVHVLPSVVTRIGGSVALLDFGNAVGRRPVPGFGEIEVVSGKWTEADFQQMLADLVDIAAGLPFAAGTPTLLPYDRSVAQERDLLYHAFVYLRYVLSDAAPPHRRLLPALRVILDEPHRVLRRVQERVPLDAARDIGPTGLARLVSGQEVMQRCKTLSGDTPLAYALRGHVPESVVETRAYTTVDTPENRFVKSFLQMASGIVSAVRAAVSEAPIGMASSLLSDCDTIERRLAPIERHILWREVGPMVHLPAASPVLQHRRGYKDVLGHSVRLRQATRVPLDADLARDLLEVKDIAKLYEVWCFFQVAGALRDVLGQPAEAAGIAHNHFEAGLPWQLRLRWRDGTELLYNATFSRSGGDRRSTYSVPLRPDIALWTSESRGGGWHLFDAKFRLDRLSDETPLADEGREDEEAADQRSTFKKADLYKMHAYRDAVAGCHSVWVLYPGTEMRFFRCDGNAVSSMTAWIESGNVPQGVGALPLSPEAGRTGTALSSLLRRLAMAREAI